MSTLARAGSLAIALVLLAGCPKSPPSATPKSKGGLDAASVTKRAKILRACDRRVLDDDLRALIADADASTRARAVAAVGQMGDPAGLALLETRLADPDPATRGAIAFSLGLIGDAAAGSALDRLAGDAEPAVRAAAADGLGRLHDPSATTRVAALLDDADPAVRRAAALAAWKFADPSTLLAGLIKNVADGDRGVRAAAAYALARLGAAPFAPASSGGSVARLAPDELKRVRDGLATRIADVEVEVRRQVARGLASPQNAAETAAVGVLSGDKDPGVRVNAVRSLGYPGIPVKPYLDRAMTDRDAGVMRVALESIGKICSGPALGLLQEHMYTYDASWLREALMTSLAQCEPARMPGIVDGLVQNPDPVMRLAVAPLIAGHREAGALRAGYALAHDPDPRVQAAGITYFADQDGALDQLIGTRLDAPDPVVRSAIVEVIGSRIERPRPGSEPRERLLEMLDAQWTAAAKDDIPDARLAVLDAAAKGAPDPRAKELLGRGLADPEIVVRRRAAERLLAAFGEDRRSEIGVASDRPLEDYEAIVRWAAVPRAAVVTLERPGSLPGRFSLRLDTETAPLAARNFAELSEKNFFDGRNVHRVVPNFVVQDGDPRGDGFGGPGYSIRDEFNTTPFAAGTLGMASDGRDTAGSQWFVTLSMQPHLDGRYTAFGRVVQGLGEIVQQIRPGDSVVSIRVYEGDGTEALPAD